MSVKRRDHKGRVLRNGESQRKDGRYAYKYLDATGTTQFVYSWKLEKTDLLPAGTRDCIALREKEKEIEKDINDGIITTLGNLTVYQLAERYLQQKDGLARKTQESYATVTNLLQKDRFGSKKVKDVKVSDVKRWIVQLKKTQYAYSSINTIKAVLKPAFQSAVEDDIVRKNPFDFTLSNVIKKDSVESEVLTEDQKRKLLQFIKSDKVYQKYYCGIVVLFNTGMRISEFSGLTVHDLDFKNGNIYINNQLQQTQRGNYVIEETKTNASKRILPMTQEVRECLREIIENREQPKVEPFIDGKCGFLYLDRNGMPMTAKNWQGCLNRICAKYNATHTEHIPHVTPHICRHTYCTTMARKGMNPKTLQYLMGHSNISITMNVYTHFGINDIRDEVMNLERGKMEE